MSKLLVGVALLFIFPAVTLGAADIAIVIDDVGYHKNRGLRAVNLPVPITIAVLPFAPHTEALAQATQRAGKDLIIHQPMEAVPAAHVRFERDTLTADMTPDQFDNTIERAISAVPKSLGFSNHTGSFLTTQREPMRRFMKHLSEHGLVFLDSRTTAGTIALQVADEMGVTALRRDVFLDHERSPAAIRAAFAQAVRIAKHKGHAILVGHPYPITLSFLEKTLADPPIGVNFVGLEALATKRHVRRQERLGLRPDPGNPHISLGQ